MINSELNKICDWLKLNKLSLNTSKSICMVFHRSQKHVMYPKIKIDQIEIEQVKEFNFFGIVLNEQLTWNNHTAYLSCKISRTNVILNRLIYYLPLKIKLALYNSLILFHINYGILTWGFVSDRIHKLQKKAVQIILLSKYNAHTDPLFKELKLLKVMDIYKLNEFKFYHNYINNKLPQYFQQRPLTPNHTIHNHTTCHNQNIHITRANNKFAQLCIRHNIPHLINNAHPLIKSKFATHRIQGFCKYVKNVFINNYVSQCTTPNCYICSRGNV